MQKRLAGALEGLAPHVHEIIGDDPISTTQLTGALEGFAMDLLPPDARGQQVLFTPHGLATLNSAFRPYLAWLENYNLTTGKSATRADRLSAFSNRVRASPISGAMAVGATTGAALSGTSGGGTGAANIPRAVIEVLSVEPCVQILYEVEKMTVDPRNGSRALCQR